METNFDWRDCILIYHSNAKFLHGETQRIRDDVFTPFEAIWNGLSAAFGVLFVAQFIWKESTLVGFFAVVTGIWFGILRLRKRAESIARRGEAVLIEAELLSAKSDKAESEGTLISYRFISLNGQVQNEQTGADEKPGRLKVGDKLVVLYAFDGSHTVL